MVKYVSNRLLQAASGALERTSKGEPKLGDAHLFRTLGDYISYRHRLNCDSFRPDCDFFRELCMQLYGKLPKSPFGRNVHLIWFDPFMIGVRADQIQHTKWDYRHFYNFEGRDAKLFEPLPEDCCQNHEQVYEANPTLQARVERHLSGWGHQPRLWFKGFRLPTLESARLEIEFGALNFRTARILTAVLDDKYNNQSGSLKLPPPLETWRNHVLDRPDQQLWNMVVLHAAILTSDDYLLFRTKTEGKEQGATENASDYEYGKWCPGIDTQFRPCYANDFYSMLEEGIEHQWGIKRGAIEFNAKLIGLGREIFALHNACAFFVIEIDSTFEEINKEYDILKEEGRFAIPVRTPEDRIALLKLIRDYERNEISSDPYHPQPKLWGSFEPHNCLNHGGDLRNYLHSTTFGLRVLFALTYRFGIKTIQEEIQQVIQGKHQLQTTHKLGSNNSLSHNSSKMPDGKLGICYFVSYAHDDRDLKDKLLKPLKQQLALAKDYCFKAWDDEKILAGERWHEQIQEALTRCDLGLLLVSPAFLSSEYIKNYELKALTEKPLIPIALKPIPSNNSIDLKGLEQVQIFRDSAGKAFQEPTSNPATREKFASELCQVIWKRIYRLTHLNQNAGDQFVD